MASRLDNSFARFKPSNFPFQSLDDVVDDFIYRFGGSGVDKGMRDRVVEYCASSRSLREAIERACASRDANGIMHNHQSRVRDSSRSLYRESLTLSLLKNRPRSFDDLYDRATQLQLWGIGEVTKYDICTRIGAYLNLPVETLYLHAGVAIGWALITGRRCPSSMKIPRSELPKPLLRISTDEVEDLLCGYKPYLKVWS